MRFVAVLIAAAFLNIGLYFILYFITPIIAGLVCGLVLRNLKRSVVAGFVGSFLAYFPLFILLEWIASGTTIDIFVIAAAAGIISLLGGLGGFLGSYLIKRNPNQVSTVSRPGV